jgi:HEPN domain-containing protein
MSDPDQKHTQWRHAAQWFVKADDDIAMAELALDREPPLVEQAALHCQQAAEKLIKALLVAASTKVRKIHDLDVLATLAGPHYPHLMAQMTEFAPATAWLGRARYPGLADDGWIEATEVAEMLTLIKAFRQKAASIAPFPV